MSHNYRYRGSTSDTDLRPEAGHYNSVNHRHISPELDFYRPHQESFPSSYSTSSSSRGSTLAQDGALSILNSCGLEPSDLALLAELPEDVLTVDALPHVLKQIKGKKGSVCSFPPSTLSPSSSYSSTSYHQAPGSSSRFWDQPSSHTIQYPLEYVGHGSEPDRWRDSRTSNTVRSDFASASLSSSRYTSDFEHTPGPSEYGKTADEFSTQEHSSFSSAGQGTSHATGISEPRSASDVYNTKPQVGRQKSQVSSTRSSSQQGAATWIPSEKEALDFHGTCPTVFPYSCSLCDITVLSDKVWIKHINNTQHAEGQLSLLQQFPNWDCRVESVSRPKNQSEKRKDEEKPTRSSQTATQNNKSKTDNKSKKQSSENGKVVFVKFPPQSVDEVYLRKLAEPFGKIVKILMFPSLAFLELNSIEQAKELVKFHVNYPPIVNGEQIEFSISDTFNFLQSSKVVSFTPAPTREGGQSDLISIVKRFGPPLYSLFLPTMAFVEMENAPDAQKLVDYYSSNTLRINNTRIKVSFSGEYKTLMQVPSAKKHVEEKISTKRTRSLSQEKGQKTESKRRKEHEQKQSSTDRRSSKSSKERRTRSKSRDKQTSSLSASRDKSKTKSNIERKTRSRSRDKSKEKASGETRTRSKSKEKSDSKRKTRSRSRDKSKEKASRGTRTRSKSKEKSDSKRKTRSRSRDKSKEKVSGKNRTRSNSKEKSDSKRKTGPGSRDESKEKASRGTRTRSKSKEKSDSKRKTRSRSRDKSKEKASGGTSTRSKSKDKSDSKRKTRSRSRDKSKEKASGGTRTRSKSKEKSDSKRKTRSRSRDKSKEKASRGTRTRSKSKERSDSKRKTGPGSRDESKEKASRGTRTRSKSKEKSDSKRKTRSRSRDKSKEKASRESKTRSTEKNGNSSTEKMVGGEKPDTESSIKVAPTACVDAAYTQQTEEDAALSTEDSDIEGMEVMGEDGENVEEEDMEIQCNVEGKEGEKEAAEKNELKAKTVDSPEKDIAVNFGNEKEEVESKMKKLEEESTIRERAQCAESQLENDEEESDFPVDLENCITLDEVEEDNSDNQGDNYRDEAEAIIEMLSSSEAQRAAQELTHKTVPLNGSKLFVNISHKDQSLSNGWETQLDHEESTSEIQSKSKTPDTKESSENCPDEGLGSETQGLNEETQKEKISEGQRVCCKEEILEAAERCQGDLDAMGDSPKPHTEQTPENDQLQDSDTVQKEQEPGPAGGTAEPEEPSKPVGTEFVRPVVGYFCNLCQLIYADEDEAKLQHCSSLMHYKNYQEKTGKDPWMS